MSTLVTLKKRLRQKVKDNASLVASAYPPRLSGANATTFANDANDAKSDATSILADPYFSGITPTTVTRPTGISLVEWREDLVVDANTVAGDPTATTADKELAAGQYTAVEDTTADLISTYT